MLALFALVSLAPRQARALPKGVRFAPTPGWTQRAEPVDASTVTPTAGVAFLLEDEQTRYVNGRSVRFVRWVREVRSEIGAGTLGQLSFQFQPPHQSLVFHRIDVKRGDSVTSRLNREAVRTLQRERGLEESLYSGAETALLLLPDVRVGDVVTCEYSLEGDNPVLAGHASEWWAQGAPVALGRLRYLLISDRPLRAHQFELAAPPIAEVVGGLHLYSWSSSGIPAQAHEDGTPTDYFAAPWIQFSDFESWADVNAWGRALFAVPKSLPKALLPVVSEIEASATTPAERATLALRWVQEHVRYFALALAENSHRPAPLDEIVARRFGDCKEKSLLTVALLRALGVDADITLVNTSWGRRLNESLPSIQAFDHAIVRARIENDSHFLDPTRLYQRGKLEDLEPSGFGFGLVLNSDEPSLVPVPDPISSKPDVAAKLRYDVDLTANVAQLTSSASYGGVRAERMRGAYASVSEEEFAKLAREAVLSLYPHARHVGKTEYSDNEAENRVSIVQHFDLANELTKNAQDVTTLELPPPRMVSLFPRIAADRKQPIALEYPHWVTEDIELHSKLPHSFCQPGQAVDFPRFSFFCNGHSSSDASTVHYEYAARASSLRVSDFEDYERARRQVYDKISLRLSFDPNARPSSAVHWSWPVFQFVQALFLIGCVLFVQFRQPYFKRPNVRWRPRLQGIRGPLVLVAIGRVTSPIQLVVAAVTTWLKLNPTAVRPLTVAAAVFWLLALLVADIYLSYLFFAKKRSFGWLYVIETSQLLLAGLIERAVGLVTTEGMLFGLWTTLAAVFWAVYLMQSERAKATFLPAPVALPELEEEHSTLEPALEDESG